MKTSFTLTNEELSNAVSGYVGKQFRGSNVRVTGTKVLEDGNVLIEADLSAKDRKPRAPREKKDATPIAKAKKA